MMLFNVICSLVCIAMDLLGTSHHDFQISKSRDKVEAVDVICGYLRLCAVMSLYVLCATSFRVRLLPPQSQCGFIRLTPLFGFKSGHVAEAQFIKAVHNLATVINSPMNLTPNKPMRVIPGLSFFFFWTYVKNRIIFSGNITSLVACRCHI